MLLFTIENILLLAVACIAITAFAVGLTPALEQSGTDDTIAYQ